MTLSVFDIFKVGIGPSSSHTMGPMRAAREFALGLERDGLLAQTEQIAVRLYGSLALTGAGHGTDRAVLAGLEGAEPETVDPDSIESTVAAHPLQPAASNSWAEHEIAFDEPMQLLFMHHERLPRHSNGMRFTALGERRRTCCARKSTTPSAAASSCAAMRPRRTRRACTSRAAVSVQLGRRVARARREHGLELFELVLANERTWATDSAVRAKLLHIWQVMQACVERGFRTDGRAARRAQGAPPRAEAVPAC